MKINQVANTMMIPVEEYNELKQQRDELLAALLEISQVACSLSPEQKIANSAIAKVKGE